MKYFDVCVFSLIYLSNMSSDNIAVIFFMLQHWGAAELIQGVGGIEFLTQLREDIETSLRPIIDQILENIMRLPEAKGQEHAPECIYHKTTDSGLYDFYLIYFFYFDPSLEGLEQKGCKT